MTRMRLCALVTLTGCGHGIRAGVDGSSGTTAATGHTGHAAGDDDDDATETPDTGSRGTSGDTAQTVFTAHTGHTGGAPWSRSPTIDGDAADYSADETWATTGGAAHITWDASTLYVAATHPDVASGGPEHWLVVYLGDGALGSSDGLAMNSQQPALAVPATHAVRRKADGSYDDLVAWTGSEWVATSSWLSSGPGQVAEAGDTVELAIPLAGIADDALAVHVSWVYEGDGYESSYAPAPPSSFQDGYDPDHGAAFLFDLTAPTPPAQQQP